jgi:AsmA protein
MKKLLIGIAVVVVLVIAAAIIVPFLIPVDTYKRELIAAVKQSTGRDLKINGKTSFSLFPSLAVEADDVALSNPPGAASPNMATFDALQMQLKLLPLLSRRVELDKLVLVNPVIALEVEKDGKPNWQFAAAAPPAARAPAAPQPAPQAAAPPSSAGGSMLAGLSLADVRLESGKISYLDRRSGAALSLDQITMKVSLPDLDSPLTADGSAVYRGEKLSLSVNLVNPRAFLDGKSSAAKLGLQSTPIAFSFSGTAAGSTPPKLDGAVDLNIPSLRNLAQWAGTPLQAPGSGFGPFAISGKVSVAGPKIAFTDAKLSLDQINATGEVALDSAGARPSVKGKLAVDKLDLNPYLPPETGGKPGASGGGGGGGAPGGPAAPAAKSAGWSDQPIDVAPLKSADVDFALSCNNLVYRKIQVGTSALGLHLVNGRLEADLTQLQLYQGSGKGKVVVDGSGAVPGIEADFDLSRVQMEPLLKAAMNTDRIIGDGAFTIAVTGHGKSQREIVGTLDGKGAFDLANGKIKGVNLVAMVKNIGSAFRAGGSDETDFGSLTGTYTIQNGILRNNDLQLKSGEVPMTGAGTVDLPRRTVDYKVTPRLAGAVAVPVIVKGPWDDLSYEPDLAGIVGNPADLLKGGAQGLGNTLQQGGPAGAQKLLKGLFGGQK